MVMTTSEDCTASGVRSLGRSAAMSLPSSSMASRTAGLMGSAGADPADRTSTRPPDRWAVYAAAIWERPALWTHTKSTEGRESGTAVLLVVVVALVSGGLRRGRLPGLPGGRLPGLLGGRLADLLDGPVREPAPEGEAHVHEAHEHRDL